MFSWKCGRGEGSTDFVFKRKETKEVRMMTKTFSKEQTCVAEKVKMRMYSNARLTQKVKIMQ